MVAPFSLDDRAERSPSDQRSLINTVSPGQVVPNKWGEGGKDAVRMQRLMHALMQMKKINIAALERAYNGE